MGGMYHKEGTTCGRFPYDLRAIRRYPCPSATDKSCESSG